MSVDDVIGTINTDPRPDELKLELAPDRQFQGALHRLGKGPKPDCYHNRVLVDEDGACVICADCRSQLDPSLVLLRMAREESRLKRLLGEEVKLKNRQRMDHEDRLTAKQKHCKHTHKHWMRTGKWYCPSCELRWDDPTQIEEPAKVAT